MLLQIINHLNDTTYNRNDIGVKLIYDCETENKKI